MSFVGSAQFVNLSFSFNSANLGPGTDTVGFYVESQSGSIASMLPLFSTATQNSNVLLAVTSGAQYGFYVENVQGNSTTYYFMNSNWNRSNSGTVSSGQNFAVYNSANNSAYYVGFGNHSGNFSPFNSMLITATYGPHGPVVAAADPPSPSGAPEPASTALAGVGLVALGYLGFRQRAE
jgi:hypothetical protein